MSSTHLSLHFHIVFSTKQRRPLISEAWRNHLYAYLGGAVRALGGIPEATGGTADHVHMLIGLRATHNLAGVLMEIKRASSRWVHESIGVQEFSWQEGYGAFTVSASNIDRVKNYIARQESHHKKISFQEEYIEFLKQTGVEYDDRYLW